MGNLEEAKREYAIVEKTAPGSKIGEIQNNIGCIYETEGLWDEALDKYRYALRLDPSLNFTHFNIARIYYEKGDINAACQEILKSLPEISLPLDLQEPYIKIITEYLRSVKHGTPAAIFYNDLGVKFAQDNLFDAADPCFRRVLELEPRYADAHFNLGLIYWKKGLRKDAIYELNAALRINPNHLLAKGLLSEIYKK
jgi:superkiller protein 3